MSLYVIVSRYEINKISKICTKADMVYNYIARSRMIGNLTFSIRIHCFSWIYIFHFLFGKLARHSLNSLYVKKHEYFVLCSFQTSYASLHIVKSNTYRVPLKSTVRPKLFVILNFGLNFFTFFHRLQPLSTDDQSVLDAEVEQLLQEQGFGWNDPYTQCVLQTLISSFRYYG